MRGSAWPTPYHKTYQHCWDKTMARTECTGSSVEHLEAVIVYLGTEVAGLDADVQLHREAIRRLGAKLREARG
jgi:hypothetical protein